MKSEDYLIYARTGQCLLRFRGDLESFPDTWLLGVPFLQAHYSIHDLENKKIGLIRVNKAKYEKVEKVEDNFLE